MAGLVGICCMTQLNSPQASLANLSLSQQCGFRWISHPRETLTVWLNRQCVVLMHVLHISVAVGKISENHWRMLLGYLYPRLYRSVQPLLVQSLHIIDSTCPGICLSGVRFLMLSRTYRKLSVQKYSSWSASYEELLYIF